MSTNDQSQSSRDRAISIYELISIGVLIVNSLLRYSMPTIKNFLIISVIVIINIFYEWKAVRKNVTDPNEFVKAARTFRIVINVILIVFLALTSMMEEAKKSIDNWNKEAEKIVVEHLGRSYKDTQSTVVRRVDTISKVLKKDVQRNSFSIIYNENDVLKIIDGKSAISIFIDDVIMEFNKIIISPLVVLLLIFVIVAIPIDWLAYWQLQRR